MFLYLWVHKCDFLGQMLTNGRDKCKSSDAKSDVSFDASCLWSYVFIVLNVRLFKVNLSCFFLSNTPDKLDTTLLFRSGSYKLDLESLFTHVDSKVVHCIGYLLLGAVDDCIYSVHNILNRGQV